MGLESNIARVLLTGEKYREEKKCHLKTEAQGGDRHVSAEAEIEMMHLQVKKQGLLTNNRQGGIIPSVSEGA